MKSQKLNDQVSSQETTEILRLAEQCLLIPGDFVELGCYRGDTSVLLGKLLAKHAGAPSSQVSSGVQKPATCAKPVENLCKNQPNQCKTAIDLCKKPDELVENACKTGAKTTFNTLDQNLRRLWIYDSFAGLPEKTHEDVSGAGQNFQAGELFVTKREVIDKIRKNCLRNVIIKKAWFDDLKNTDLPEQIAFAFLDGDLYSSIKTSLRLVAPRLQPQGIMVVHDYNNPELPGSSRAVDEFLCARPNYRLTVRYTLAIITRTSP